MILINLSMGLNKLFVLFLDIPRNKAEGEISQLIMFIAFALSMIICVRLMANFCIQLIIDQKHILKVRFGDLLGGQMKISVFFVNSYDSPAARLLNRSNSWDIFIFIHFD